MWLHSSQLRSPLDAIEYDNAEYKLLIPTIFNIKIEQKCNLRHFIIFICYPCRKKKRHTFVHWPIDKIYIYLYKFYTYVVTDIFKQKLSFLIIWQAGLINILPTQAKNRLIFALINIFDKSRKIQFYGIFQYRGLIDF